MKKLTLILSCIIAIHAHTASGQSIDPDNATLALANLEQTQAHLFHAPATMERLISQPAYCLRQKPRSRITL